MHYLRITLYWARVIVVVIRLVIGDPVRPGRLLVSDISVFVFPAACAPPGGINTLDLIQSPGLISGPLGTVHVRAI